MTTRVGELYADLRLDDSQFVTAMARNQQGLQRLGTTATTSANTVSQSGRAAAAGLDTIAQSAGRAATATNSVALNSSLSQDAQRAVAAYHDLQREADKFADAALDAHDKAAGAADDQRKAEERLADTYSRTASTADEVVDAEDEVARSRDIATAASRASSAASDAMETSMRRAGQAARDSAGDIETAARESREALETAATAAETSGRRAGTGYARGLGNKLGSGVSRAGAKAGTLGGDNFLSTFASKIGDLAGSTGPIAGSILGVATIGLTAGALLAGAIKDGMKSELTRDLFQAQTGVTEAQAKTFGLAAGEAYANAFGESVGGNLSTGKIALQNDLVDADANAREIQKIVEQLDGVSTILGEEIPSVARAAGKAVQTGFAADVTDAFDLMVQGSYIGLNVSEDMLDSIIEYGVQFESVGLTGAEAMGLMSQAVKNGARDTDLAADAIKEFSLKVVDGSTASAEAYQALGMDAEDMTRRFAEGGDSARDAMTELLPAIQNMTDPVAKTAVATGLFGTQAEDLGDALNHLDLATATQSMNDYEGAAQSAIDVMGDNAFTSVQGAMNGISTAANGLKAALAQAFGPYIQEFADTVSNNRAGVIGFFIDVANTGFDAAGAIVQFVGKGLIGLAEFAQAGSDMSVSFMRSIADMLSGLDMIGTIMSAIIPGFDFDTGDMAKKLNDVADMAEKAGDATAEGLRTAGRYMAEEMPGQIDTLQERFNKVAMPLKQSAAFNDTLTKLNNTITELGVNADGDLIQFDTATWTGKLDKAIPMQAAMSESLDGLRGQFEDQIRTGLEAGATVEELTGQYAANRDGLIRQATSMGLNNDQALALVNSFGLVPELAETQIRLPGMPEAMTNLDLVRDYVTTDNEKNVLVSDTSDSTLDALKTINATVLNGKIVPIDADDDQAWRDIKALTDPKSLIITAEVRKSRNQLGMTDAAWSKAMNDSAAYRAQSNADGSVRTEKFANGGDTLPSDATIQSPRSKLVQWAEPETGGEAFIPLSPSKRNRSMRILADVARRFGVSMLGSAGVAMDDGGVLENPAAVRAIEGAKSVNGIGYEYGQLDCSGYQSQIYNDLTGNDARFTTDSDFAALGFVKGPDPSGNGYNVGTDGGTGRTGHMAGSLFGVPVESGGAHGTVAYGGDAADETNFSTNTGNREVWHLPRSEWNPPMGDDPDSARNPIGYSTETDSSSSASGGDDSASSSSSSSSAAGDGQRVHVTNWPSTLGGDTAESEGKPKAQFAAKWFADGGIENHDAHVSQGLRVFGEPETGGEAYIPLSAAKRGRSEKILTEVARRFGMSVYADGGFGGVGNDSGSGEHVGSWEVLKQAPQGNVPLSTPRKDAGLEVWASNAYKAVSAGVGLALTAASGFDSSGKFVGFDTSNNSIPGFDKVLEQLGEIAAKPTVVITKAEINDPAGIVRDVVDESGLANLAILQRGI